MSSDRLTWVGLVRVEADIVGESRREDVPDPKFHTTETGLRASSPATVSWTDLPSVGAYVKFKTESVFLGDGLCGRP